MTTRIERDRAKRRRLLTRQLDAGGLATEKALEALKLLDPADFPPYMIPKLAEVGASITQDAMALLKLLDAEENPKDDPWQKIADELEGATALPDGIWAAGSGGYEAPG